ncbi:MAG: PLP-dependent aminotransferase family protein, partial [Lysobacter sp.]
QAEYLTAVARHFPRGTRVTRPGGGYFLWLELPAGTDALAIQRGAIANGISIAPGPMFSASRGFGNCLRLNCGHPLDARAQGALATLGRFARAAHGAGKAV